MPDLLTVALFAYPLASAALGYWIARQVDTFSSWRARRSHAAAAEERRKAEAARRDAAVLADLWLDLDGASAHKAYGARVHDLCTTLKAERDQARKEAKEWEQAAYAFSEEAAESARRSSPEESWPEDWL